MDTSILNIDCAAEAGRIEGFLRDTVRKRFRRRGVVLGISGGVDSSVSAALCVRALGADNVLGLKMPESDSAASSSILADDLARSLGIRTINWSISASLRALGCYDLRTEAVRTAIPGFKPDWPFKLVLPGLLEGDRLRVSSVVALTPDGETREARLNPEAYRQLVAATNFKQRVRKMLEYYHADLHNYAVAGTPNRLEYELGFFVKQGDGSADVKPIAHLYKTQVYQLAEYLELPAAIRDQPPSTDTYSLPQTQEEFYFAVPPGQMDLCLYGFHRDMPPAELGELAGLRPEQVERVYRDIAAKRRVASYLRAEPSTLPPG